MTKKRPQYRIPFFIFRKAYFYGGPINLTNIFQLFRFINSHEASFRTLSICNHYFRNFVTIGHVSENFRFPPSHHVIIHHDLSSAVFTTNGMFSITIVRILILEKFSFRLFQKEMTKSQFHLGSRLGKT